MSNIESLTVSGKELGAVIGITDRRVQQLADEGIFERVARGRYLLAACVRAYVAESAKDDDELRTERIGLVRAQRRRLELENLRNESAEAGLDWQDAVVGAFEIEWALRLYPVAMWMHDLLRDKQVPEPHILAGALQGWLIALRTQIEEDMRKAAAEARRRQMVVQDAGELLRLIGRSESDIDEDQAS